MVYDDVFEAAAELDMELYAASTWSRGAENKRNGEFVKR